MKYRSITLAAVTLLVFTQAAVAEDLDTIFTKVKELSAAGNYTKAMEELKWAQKELEKQHFAKLETLLPAELAGFQGQKVESQSAIGITTVERTYTKGSEKVKLSLAGGSAGGAMGGFAALGRMAGIMGTQPGVDTFRIEGRTANLQVRNGRAELTVFLESGSFLKLEQRKAKDGETLKQMAEGLKTEIVKLDNYLKGTS